MREIVLFVEDFAHKAFLEALVHRIAVESGIEVQLSWLNARRGHGAVVNELRQFLQELQRGRRSLPSLLVVATDANCMGRSTRLEQINDLTAKVNVTAVYAVPDPHIERWLLVDSAAFKAVFGRGCDAPNQKCERARYKKMLIDAILATGISASLGGIEFSKDIVDAMDLNRVAAADPSLGKLIEDLRSVFQTWTQD